MGGFAVLETGGSFIHINKTYSLKVISKFRSFLKKHDICSAENSNKFSH